MLSSKSSETAAPAARERLRSDVMLKDIKADRPHRTGPGRAGSSACRSSESSSRVEKTAEKFASVFYSMLFKSMQKTVPRADAGAVSSGARGLVGRYLPRTMARSGSGPLTRYIERNVAQGQEGGIDERI